MPSLVKYGKWQISPLPQTKFGAPHPPKCGLIDIPGIYTLFNA